MDINFIRIAVTITCFVLFVAIALWAYGSGRRQAFDEAARLPLEDDAVFPPDRAGEGR